MVSRKVSRASKPRWSDLSDSNLVTCPVTGLPITRHPEWTDIDLGQGYTATLKLIGDRILYNTTSTGHRATAAGVRKLFQARERVIQTMIPSGVSFLVLEDFTNAVAPVPREARLEYVRQSRRHRERTLAVIGFKARLFIKLAMSFGRRLYKTPYPVFVVPDYTAAITAAEHILNRASPAKPAPHVEVTSQPNWCFETQGYSATYQVLQGNVLHAVSNGRPRSRDLEAAFELPYKVRAESARGDFEYVVSNSLTLPRNSLKQFHVHHPIRMCIVYGDSRLTRTLTRIAGAFLPFPIRVTRDLDGALAMVRDHTRWVARSLAPDPAAAPTSCPHDEIQVYVDELLRYIGSINWETQGIECEEEIAQSHPFRAVFKGIALIKGELEDLLAERQGATEALRRSEEKYRNILDSIEDGYFELDLRGSLVFCNDSVCNMLGYDREGIAALRYKDFLDEADVKRALEVARGVYERRQGRELFECNVRRSDGAKIFVEASLTLRLDGGGRPAGLRGIARDMTDRRRALEERRQLEQKLQHAERMEAVGTLAGGVAHELNNILMGIVSYPDLLLMELPEDSDMRKPLATIKQSGQRAAMIVQDLLSLARRGLTPTEVSNINRIVRDYLESPEQRSLEQYHAGVQISVDLAPDLLNLVGSPTHLSKVVMNLLSNAAEAMPRGGEIFISSENRHVDTTTGGFEPIAPGDYVVLSVRDTGTGIPSPDLERIFEPFYTKKIMGRSGTGLGMAVIWATVKDHKGYIDVESFEGQGTTFTLYFPATRQGAPQKSAVAVEHCLGRGESVLVVDDVEEQRTIAAGVLGKLGYRVDAVASGEKAVEYLQEKQADLVILDMIMEPGIDGLETYKRLLDLRPGQRAIIASGFSESERVKEAQRLGAGSYLRKPYLIENLGIAVRTELDRAGPHFATGS